MPGAGAPHPVAGRPLDPQTNPPKFQPDSAPALTSHARGCGATLIGYVSKPQALAQSNRIGLRHWAPSLLGARALPVGRNQSPLGKIECLAPPGAWKFKSSHPVFFLCSTGPTPDALGPTVPLSALCPFEMFGLRTKQIQSTFTLSDLGEVTYLSQFPLHRLCSEGKGR